MKTEDRKNRIVARGEHSNHSHVIVGDAEVRRNENGEINITTGKEGATLRHILESNWLEGEEVWTGEHEDVKLEPNREYTYVAQEEYDPFEDVVRRVLD